MLPGMRRLAVSVLVFAIGIAACGGTTSGPTTWNGPPRPFPDDGVLAVDDLMRSGGRLAPLAESMIAKLDKVLPANWSRGNPIDIIGDAAPDRYAATMDVVLADCTADAILVMNCPTALASSSDAAQAVIDAVARAPTPERLPPVLTNWLGEGAVAEARRKFREASIPTYESPTDAVKGFFYLWQHTLAQEVLMRTPPRRSIGCASSAIDGMLVRSRTAMAVPDALSSTVGGGGASRISTIAFGGVR